jgi:hypothetical protein
MPSKKLPSLKNSMMNSPYLVATMTYLFQPFPLGKNDLWIATTAAIHEATLLSMDADFKHLDSVFFYFEHISQN